MFRKLIKQIDRVMCDLSCRFHLFWTNRWARYWAEEEFQNTLRQCRPADEVIAEVMAKRGIKEYGTKEND